MNPKAAGFLAFWRLERENEPGDGGPRLMGPAEDEAESA
jgi:hypothetical protein